jgi:hypothetical protein
MAKLFQIEGFLVDESEDLRDANAEMLVTRALAAIGLQYRYRNFEGIREVYDDETRQEIMEGPTR